jgi:hypothetical protein
VKKNPSDKNAKLQYVECDKIVKRDAFLKAIEVDDAPSAAEGLDLDSMVVEDTYDGVRLENEMTQKFIDDMIVRFKDGKKIHRKYVFQIIIAVKDIVHEEPTMVEVDIDPNQTLTVCGDTHGKKPKTLAALQPPRSDILRRAILRFARNFPPQWLPVRKTLLPVQWRFRRQGILVDRDRASSLLVQMAVPEIVLPKPW